MCHINIIIIAAVVLISGGNSSVKIFISCDFFPPYDLLILIQYIAFQKIAFQEQYSALILIYLF